MDGELMRYVSRDVRPARSDRAVVGRARQTYDQVREAAFAVDGAVAFAEHAMERAVRLDRARQVLSQGDVTLDLMLSGIQADAMNTVRKIGRDLYSGWGL